MREVNETEGMDGPENGSFGRGVAFTKLTKTQADWPVMEKISHRTADDCVICVLTMVMGPPYTYERVSQDSKKYRRTDDQGRFVAWWKDYLTDEGLQIEYKPLSNSKPFLDLASLPENSRAMLVFAKPHLKIGHAVAIDQCGVIDPQDHPAEYKSVDDFREIFRIEGWQLYSHHFWLIRKHNGF